MSRRRHLEPFRKYSDCPSLETRRRTEISLKRTNSPGADPSLLSNTSSMEACPTGFLALEPLKMTSVMDSPRRYLAELSPITHRTASIILDLPQPLGPTTAVMLEGNGTVVGSTKDLKPDSLMDFRRISGARFLPENRQHLLPLMFPEGLDYRLQTFWVVINSSICQLAEEGRRFADFLPEVFQRHKIGTADGRPEVFQGFFQKGIFDQTIGVAHNPEPGVNDLLGGICTGGIEGVDYCLQFANLAHNTAKLLSGPAFKHLSPEHE